jgi:AcrR family transcriptional regulator
MRQPVKGRSEAGRRRESRAHETRKRIAGEGLRLFLEKGYVGATVQAIAEAARVAPATVYQAFGTKHAVLAAALDIMVVGDDASPSVLYQDWVDEVRRERNPDRQLRLVAEGTSRIAARTAPIKEVMRDAAATESAARELIREDHEGRYRTQARLVDLLIENRPLRAGMDRRRAIDTYFAIVNSTTYELLVVQRGWTLSEWQAWIADVIERTLFAERAVPIGDPTSVYKAIP